MDKGVKDLHRLSQAHTKCEREKTARWTKSRVVKNTHKVEPLCIKPQMVDHRCPSKAYCVLKPSKTGIPIIGKATITDIRLLKELFDVYALLYDLVVDQPLNYHFVKGKMMIMKSLCSKNKKFYQSWYIRSMERSISLELRFLRKCVSHRVAQESAFVQTSFASGNGDL